MKILFARLWQKIFILVVVLAAIGYSTYLYLKPGQVPDYILYEVEIGTVENVIAASGTLEPKEYVEVGAQVSGQLKSLAVEVGDLVQRGDLLAEIDATVFETKVMGATASLENKRAQLEKLQAESYLAEERKARNTRLFAQNAISQDTLTSSQTDVKTINASIRAMEAEIRADEASLEGDRATLNYAKIYAPMTGTVVSIAVREGQTLNANQNAPLIMKIANLDVLTLRAEVSEADVTRIQPGMDVYFATLGNPDERWNSTVRQVLPTPEVVNDVVLYQVLIDIKNRNSRLMDSMTAQTFFVESRAEEVVTIPVGAIRDGRRGSRVVKQTAPGQFEPVPVEIGVRTRTQAEVISGLQVGDVVVAGNRDDSKANARAGGGMPKGGMSDNRGGRRGGF
ncbi:efflux RND transporter periplasmic adaptor subunit [Gilvimarinus polysaccharolyticus]|uniref:efflux RND transporter periplasmic adaptor subunit n=1 Tax=Gilvimarinus polysaccharolyticus TaxID=863921 RepID=UPI000673309A|nr:efflux RND transporter periplasmic adaptor subunit [Gilvimarinus polysaccharolyticus]